MQFSPVGENFSDLSWQMKIRIFFYRHSLLAQHWLKAASGTLPPQCSQPALWSGWACSCCGIRPLVFPQTAFTECEGLWEACQSLGTSHWACTSVVPWEAPSTHSLMETRWLPILYLRKQALKGQEASPSHTPTTCWSSKHGESRSSVNEYTLYYIHIMKSQWDSWQHSPHSPCPGALFWAAGTSGFLSLVSVWGDGRASPMPFFQNPDLFIIYQVELLQIKDKKSEMSQALHTS